MLVSHNNTDRGRRSLISNRLTKYEAETVLVREKWSCCTVKACLDGPLLREVERNRRIIRQIARLNPGTR